MISRRNDIYHLCKLDLLHELDLIPQFPSLRTFIWTAGFATSVRWIYFGGFGDETGVKDQRRLVNSWFSRSKNLQTAYFHVHKSRSEPQSYLRWTKGETDPAVVSYEEAIESHDVISWYP